MKLTNNKKIIKQDRSAPNTQQTSSIKNFFESLMPECGERDDFVERFEKFEPNSWEQVQATVIKDLEDISYPFMAVYNWISGSIVRVDSTVVETKPIDPESPGKTPKTPAVVGHSIYKNSPLQRKTDKRAGDEKSDMYGKQDNRSGKMQQRLRKARVSFFGVDDLSENELSVKSDSVNSPELDSVVHFNTFPLIRSNSLQNNMMALPRAKRGSLRRHNSLPHMPGLFNDCKLINGNISDDTTSFKTSSTHACESPDDLSKEPTSSHKDDETEVITHELASKTQDTEMKGHNILKVHIKTGDRNVLLQRHAFSEMNVASQTVKRKVPTPMKVPYSMHEMKEIKTFINKVYDESLEGVLEKKAKWKFVYSRRFVQLRQFCLYIYKDQTQSQVSEVVDFLETPMILEMENEDGSRFRLMSVDGKESTVWRIFADAPSKELWLEALRKVVKACAFAAQLNMPRGAASVNESPNLANRPFPVQIRRRKNMF